MYEVGLNEPVLFFFCAKRNNKKHGRACTVVWVQTCLSYSHHLFILLAVKTILQFGWRKRRSNEKNCSRINYHTEESRLKTK